MKKTTFDLRPSTFDRRKAYVKPAMRTADIQTQWLLITSDTLDIFKDDDEWPYDPETGEPVEPW